MRVDADTAASLIVIARELQSRVGKTVQAFILEAVTALECCVRHLSFKQEEVLVVALRAMSLKDN